MKNKYKSTQLCFSTLSEVVKIIVDSRKINSTFKKDVGFEVENYDTDNFSCSVKNEYADDIQTWFESKGCVLKEKYKIFRASDVIFLQRSSMYRINCDGNSAKYMINRYKDSYDLDFNPKFQRGYVWTLKQKQKYIEYLISGGISGREIYFNCPGFMGNSGQMVVVDGKQRL